jgi:hypothetical protein
MTQRADTEIRDLKASIDTLTKSISDLTLEVRVGFAEMKGEIGTSEAKLEGKIGKFDERTGNCSRRSSGINGDFY